MIEAKNLTKEFPGTRAVDDLSFNIAKGEIVGFLGPNGAGKTTTMRMLTSYFVPTSGKATVAGYDTIQDSLKVRKAVGYLPENNPLYNEMRVKEYLGFRARLKGVGKGSVAKALELVGLNESGRIIGHLSKGQKQRVGLADAILHDPEVLILDEPTLGLDPNQVRQVRELISNLAGRKTVILSTHILPEVELMCRRVLIMNMGRLVASGTTAEIARMLQIPGRIRVEVRNGGRAVKDQIEGLTEVERVLWKSKGDVDTYTVETRNQIDARERISSMAAQQRWILLELAIDRLSLEEAFARLTDDKGK